MGYASIFNQAKIIKTSGALVVPPTYKDSIDFIMPDQIVHHCINEYDLLKKGMPMIDPMCGIGTIPRIINQRGGDCIGIEINENRFNAALELSDKSTLSLGDCLSMPLPTHFFHCIFTSLPFSWFKYGTEVSGDYAIKFRQLLKQNGFILLDSLPSVARAGEEWPVALLQCNYLEANGFLLSDIIRFKHDTHVDSINESVIMKFLPADSDNLMR